MKLEIKKILVAIRFFAKKKKNSSGQFEPIYTHLEKKKNGIVIKFCRLFTINNKRPKKLDVTHGLI